VTAKDGIATLNGRVPSALEAMLAFRAAQQTPGVREVDDQLEFPVPAEGERNPLVDKARPEDLEPYLEAQVRRQLGDQAHLDRIKVTGDRLEIHGSVANIADRPRAEAILRSMPLLRGFQIQSEFLAD
jgi:osmotically-inducible protein OsmY